uniref:NADH dehydrogenase subunit 4L n=1 Tax=Angiostrongylus vasorum TaxID=321387 RepID=J7G1J9_ANGVA|nr:NADH dehydrogenase subunit 4L [Angiostrongylus vasorum]AFP58673.1 NADH dehydrogenase subunit 4L [Angiostrongylus vasorum]
MIFLFFSLLMLFFKWSRFIFVLISLEFLMMSSFFVSFWVVLSYNCFFFMCHSVVSSIMGMVVMVGSVKFFGSDLSIF